MRLKQIIFFVSLLTSIESFAQQSWSSWVADVRKEALSEGVRPAVFDMAFADIHEPSHQVKGLAKSQPEHRITYQKYLNSRVDGYRISVGRSQYKRNQAIADEIAKVYGVDPCFIMSFWGMETSYGSYMGNFPVIKSLATLGYDSNRQAFFRKELLLGLHILNEGHVSMSDFKDIWKSKPDVFASIANYMKMNGWHEHDPWAIFVTLPKNFDPHLQGKSTIKPVREWSAMGVRTLDGKTLPYPNLDASIVQPNGGPVFLAYPNYKMILKYNNSIYYAGAIGYLADKICNRKMD